MKARYSENLNSEVAISSRKGLYKDKNKAILDFGEMTFFRKNLV